MGRPCFALRRRNPDGSDARLVLEDGVAQYND